MALSDSVLSFSQILFFTIHVSYTWYHFYLNLHSICFYFTVKRRCPDPHVLINKLTPSALRSFLHLKNWCLFQCRAFVILKVVSPGVTSQTLLIHLLSLKSSVNKEMIWYWPTTSWLRPDLMLLLLILLVFKSPDTIKPYWNKNWQQTTGFLQTSIL